MTRELPDELLSAYLDGEASAAERAAVEAHLATSEADRQLLAELRSLKGDMAALPRATVGPDFADRVVQAAVAAKAAASPAMPLKRNRRNWMVAAGAIGAVAACLFLTVVFWRPPTNPTLGGGSSTPQDRMLAALHAAVPGDGQATVLRLRLPPGSQLEAAIAAAGLGLREANANTGASEFGAAYRAHLQTLGSEETVAAAQAVFVEATLAHLEKLVTALASDPALTCELRAEAQLAFSLPKPTDIDPDGVGEARPGVKAVPPPGQPFVQYLPAGLFRLQKLAADAAAAEPVHAKPAAERVVRVLILIEQ